MNTKDKVSSIGIAVSSQLPSEDHFIVKLSLDILKNPLRYFKDVDRRFTYSLTLSDISTYVLKDSSFKIVFISKSLNRSMEISREGITYKDLKGSKHEL